MSHTYEEIRDAVLSILAGHEGEILDPRTQQYVHLRNGVAQVFARRGTPSAPPDRKGDALLSEEDNDLFLEVFWNLFQQGIIILGRDDSQPGLPYFRLSSFGCRFLEDHNSLFFHDVSSYMERIVAEIPNIDDTTKPYLEEAMRAFMAMCYLSSTVMLGVAIEHTFDLLTETIAKNTTYARIFEPVSKLRHYSPRVKKFKSLLEAHMGTLCLDDEIKKDLEAQFSGILELIRNFRNDSGHPTGKLIKHEQAFILLQLFIPYCKKMYQLRDFFTM